MRTSRLALVASTFLAACSSGSSGTTPAAVDAGRSTLTASPGSLIANAVAQATLTATALDAGGGALTGKTAVFTVSGNGNLLSSTSAPTGAGGIASVTLASTRAEVKDLSVTIDGVPVSAHASVTFVAGQPAAGTSTLEASPTSTTDDGTPVMLLASIRDLYGNPVAGADVLLASSPSATVTQPVSSTDADGATSGVLATLTSGTRAVTASVGGVAVAFTNVEVQPAPASASESSVVVVGSPWPADGLTPITVTVTVLDTAGRPMAGQSVALAYGGNANVVPPTGTTGALGVVTFDVTAPAATVGALTATVNPGAGEVVLSPQPTLEFYACTGGGTFCSATCVDLATNAGNCGSCGHGCGGGCVAGRCVDLPVYQHRWSDVTSIPAVNWATLTGSSFPVTTHGGPLEIELSIPLVAGSHSSCRPMIDGAWAGSFEGLPSAYFWHEGLDFTGYASGTVRRMWNRTRTYFGIPGGSHVVSVQCKTDGGTVAAGQAGATALAITREFLGSNKVFQKVSLTGTTMGASGAMVKVPGTDLAVTTSGSPLEITISLPIGNGGHAGCLEWMDDALIPSTPAYSNAYWYAGLEATYRGWIMWHHTRVYTGIPAGGHTFSIRCYNDSGTLLMSSTDMASVLSVKEIDQTEYPASQVLKAYGSGREVSSGAANTWTTLPTLARTITVARGSVEISSHLVYNTVAAGNVVTCRPMLDGLWAGSFAGLSFASNVEEGGTHEVYEGTGWNGMWHRRRAYTGIPPGTHALSLQCLSTAAGWNIEQYGVTSLLAREVDVVSDQ